MKIFLVSLLVVVATHLNSAAANGDDAATIEKRITKALEQFEEKIVERLELYLQRPNSQAEDTQFVCDDKPDLSTNNEHKEVMEKVAAIEGQLNKIEKTLEQLVLPVVSSDKAVLSNLQGVQKAIAGQQNKTEKVLEQLVSSLVSSDKAVLRHLQDVQGAIAGQQNKTEKVLEQLVSSLVSSDKAVLSNLQDVQETIAGQQNKTEKILEQLVSSLVSSDKAVLRYLQDVQETISGQLNKTEKALVSPLVSGHKAVLSNLQDVKQTIVASESEVPASIKHVEKTVEESNDSLLPPSCSDLNVNETDAYYIQPRVENAEPFKVLCDFESNHGIGGGWTVFQHRFDGSVNFYQNWTMYKTGFGQVTQEHWLGLEKLHTITSTGPHQLLVLLEDFDGSSAYALYDDFSIGSEAEVYTLTVGKYLNGTAGDSFTFHNGMKFSTFDKESSKGCSKFYHGAWWFEHCYSSHLNGKYQQKEKYDGKGLKWKAYKPDDPLKTTKMMLRRRA